MLNRLRSLPRRLVRRGFRLSDLVLGSIGNPRLALMAARHVLRRKARILESGIRQAESRHRIRAAERPLATRDHLLGQLATQAGILLLSEQEQSAHIGIAEVEMLTALAWLSHNVPGARMEIGGRRVTFGMPNFKSLALAAPNVNVTYQSAAGDLDTLVVEPYFRQGPRKWISQNTSNLAARAIYDDRLETPGLSRLPDLLGAPAFVDAVAQRPIDVVYTWVNHADPDWAEMYARHKQIAAGKKPASQDDTPQPGSNDAMALSRFHSNDELRYSLRSVAANLPWVRQIHVFTNCAPPDWLKSEHPRIRWVQHEEAIPSDYLPTFSSHVIESCLHRIPGLADHFIYINDDVFIGQPLPKSFFFDPNGCSKSLLEPYGMVSGAMTEGDPDYLNAARNSAALIRNTFGTAPTQLHRHTSFALRRDILEEMEARWPDRFHALRRNRFRTSHDLNVTSFLYHHYGLATGRVIASTARTAFVKSLDVRWRVQLAAIPEASPDIICINEGGDMAPSRDWHGSVRDFLRNSWPHSAPWER